MGINFLDWKYEIINYIEDNLGDWLDEDCYDDGNGNFSVYVEKYKIVFQVNGEELIIDNGFEISLSNDRYSRDDLKKICDVLDYIEGLFK